MALPVNAHSSFNSILSAKDHLDIFNDDIGASKDLARFENLKSHVRMTGPVVNYINLLQIESFIPARVALLIKNNLNDQPFIKNTISSLLFDFREKDIISQECFHYLHEKLNRGSLEDLFQCLHMVMLYARIADHHNQTQRDPAFHFEPSSSYSQKLIRLSPHAMKTEWKKLQKQRQIDFLTNWLTAFGREQKCPARVTPRLHPLITLLEANKETDFKQQFLSLLIDLQNSLETTAIEKICWKELQDALQPIPDEQFVNQLYQLIATEEYYRNCIQKVQRLEDQLRAAPHAELANIADKCKKAYNGSVFVLQDQKNLPSCSPTRFSLFVGRMRNQWQKISNIYCRACPQISHRMCSCQAEASPTQNRLVEWPFNTKPLVRFTQKELDQLNAPNPSINPASFHTNQENTIAIIGCDWGGGHQEVSRGLALHMAKLGYHPVTINLPEVLISEDPIRNFFLTKWLGKEWSVGSMFNGLLKAKAFAMINFLRSFTQGAPDPEAHQRKLLMTVQQLLKINPKQVFTTYSADNEVIIEACQLLGIPCLHIATDIDTSIETRDTPPNTDHFKMGIAFNEPGMIDKIKNATRLDQRVILGPPVRHHFTLHHSPEDVLRFKQKWGIDANKKVIVISNGKNGVNSPYPEILAKRYAGMNLRDIPIHLVVLCGKGNKEFFDYLEQNVVNKTAIPISLIKEALNGEEMGELMAMASQGGMFIGKAGGGTIFEAASQGTRLLIDNVRAGACSQGVVHFLVTCVEWLLRKCGYKSQLPWEKINSDFAVNHHFADIFKSEEEFLSKFERLLSHRTPANLGLEIKNIENEIRDVTSEMIHRADNDIAIRHIRERIAQI